MQTFIDFLVNNYLWFLIISLILVFALIGYLVDTSEQSGKNKKEDVLNDSVIEPNVEDLKSLDEGSQMASNPSQETEVLEDSE